MENQSTNSTVPSVAEKNGHTSPESNVNVNELVEQTDQNHTHMSVTNTEHVQGDSGLKLTFKIDRNSNNTDMLFQAPEQTDLQVENSEQCEMPAEKSNTHVEKSEQANEPNIHVQTNEQNEPNEQMKVQIEMPEQMKLPVEHPLQPTVSNKSAVQNITNTSLYSPTGNSFNISNGDEQAVTSNIPQSFMPNIPTTITRDTVSPYKPAIPGTEKEGAVLENTIPTQTSDFNGMANLTGTPEPKSGRKGKTKRRGSAWTDDETDFLMEVWARHSDAGGSEEFPHNTPVYRLISKAMIEKGFDKSWEQCKTRIHTLKRAYKLTVDEIKAGNTSIIYCKHYDKLKILMGDDQVMVPKVLAENLAIKREEREITAKNVQSGAEPPPPPPPATPKRKLTSNEKAVKRQNSGNSDKSPISSTSFNSALNIAPGTETSFPTQTNVASSANVWYPTVQTQSVAPVTTTMVAPQQPTTVYIPPVQYQMPPPPPYQPTQSPYQPVPSTYQSVPPTYQSPPVYTQNQTAAPPPPPPQVAHQRPQLQEINNNNINIAVKTERNDEPMKPVYGNIPTPVLNLGKVQPTQIHNLNINSNNNNLNMNTHQTKSSLQQKKEELEKLKLDLEMRKLEMERNKLEMEERQRREERDHQYRMMQLLLFGLGQQNAGNAVGHVTEQELGHVPNTITLSRAIENGLLPSDTLRANEKGLSFNEI